MKFHDGNGPMAGVTRINNFLLTRSLLVSLEGFPKFLLIFKAWVILKVWDTELETGVVVSN